MSDDKTEYDLVRIDKDTKAKLLDLANASHRSMAAHLRFLIENDYERMMSEVIPTTG